VRTNDFFRTWIIVAMQQVKKALDSQATRIHIVCFCRSGRHRSVACAGLLQHLLEAGGAKISLNRHLCRETWSSKRPPCEGNGICSRRCSETAERTQVLRELRAMWRQLVLGNTSRTLHPFHMLVFLCHFIIYSPVSQLITKCY
jgi:hypothetical protein